MATNPSTLPENSGRITAPDANYLYGSAKDDSTGTTGDGTPIKKALMNDTYGFQQALLRAASLVPTGAADSAIASQYLQALVQQAMGRAVNFDDTGVADAYVLGLRANQQAPGGLFDGQVVAFPATGGNTGASTLDVSALLGQAPGTTVKDVELEDGSALIAGDILAAGQTVLRYDLALDAFVVPDTIAYVRRLNSRTWQTVGKSAGVTYLNDDKTPRQVAIGLDKTSPTPSSWNFQIDGVTRLDKAMATNFQYDDTLFIEVPPGSTYRINLTGHSIDVWSELAE